MTWRILWKNVAYHHSQYHCCIKLYYHYISYITVNNQLSVLSPTFDEWLANTEARRIRTLFFLNEFPQSFNDCFTLQEALENFLILIAENQIYHLLDHIRYIIGQHLLNHLFCFWCEFVTLATILHVFQSYRSSC